MSQIALVGTAAQNSTGSSVGSNSATRADVQVGDVILVFVIQPLGTKQTITMSDNHSQVYSAVGTALEIAGADDLSVTCYRTIATVTASYTTTCTFGGNVVNSGIWVELIRGNSASPLGASAFTGQTQITVSTTANAITSGTATPGSGDAGAWLVVGFSVNGSGLEGPPFNPPSAGTGFTDGGAGWNFSLAGNFARSESKRVTSPAAVAATFTAVTVDDFVTFVSIWDEALPPSSLFFGAGTTS